MNKSVHISEITKTIAEFVDAILSVEPKLPANEVLGAKYVIHEETVLPC